MNYPWLVLGVVGLSAFAVPAARITKQYAAVATLASSAILILQYLYFHYTSDDAYISYRYARNLADGIGPVWNPGEHVEGYTNFLWMASLAGLDKLGAGIVPTGRWLGFALAITSCALTFALVREIVEGEAGAIAGVAAALVLAASGTWALWAGAGLEAPLFATLTLVAVRLHVRERRSRTFPVSGVVWGMVALTRPDGLVLVAITSASRLLDLVSDIRSDEGVRSPAAPLARFAGWLAGFAIVFAPYDAWRSAYYGHPLANTYYAKVGSGLAQYNRGLDYVLSFLQQSGGWLLLLVPVAIAASPARRIDLAYLLTLVVGWLAYTAYVGGDSLLLFRFVAPILPLYYALIAVSAATLLTSMRLERAPPRLALEAGIAAAVLALVAFTMHPTSTNAVPIRAERRAVDDRADIGRWLRDNTPETASVAAVPVGAIGYESRRTIIDMLGITDEHIAHRDVSIGDFAAGHEKYDSGYVLDRKPDIIILFDNLSPSPATGADYAGLKGVFIPAVVDMVENPRLAAEYERRAVQVREGKWLNLLVRQGASAVLARTQPAPP